MAAPDQPTDLAEVADYLGDNASTIIHPRIRRKMVPVTAATMIAALRLASLILPFRISLLM